MSIFKTNYRKIISFAICLCIVFSASITSKAVGFAHKHTSACYSIVQAECSSHHSENVVPEQGTQHCTNCLTMKSVTTYVKWDICSSTGLKREKGGYHICNTCGAKLNEWSVGVGAHIVDTRKLTCGKTNVTYGNLVLEAATTEWTKVSFPLIASFTDNSKTIALSLRPYSWDEGKTWVTENELSVERNGVYTVVLRENGGSTIKESIEVKNFDYDAPVIHNIHASTDEWTNQPIIINCVAQDLQPDGSEGSGLAQYAYCINGEEWKEDGSFLISQNGTYSLRVRDQLDNITETIYNVHNIDVTPPVIVKSGVREGGWQKGDVTIEVEANDQMGCGLHEEAYSIGEEWQAQNEFTVSENGEYEVKVRDALEQISVAYVNVTGIDKESPIIESVEADKSQLFEEKVYVTVAASDRGASGLDENAFSIDGGENWSAESSFWVEIGKEYEIVVRDKAGNYSDTKEISREEFEYPPKEDPPKEETPKEETPKEDPTQEEKPVADTPKEEPNKEPINNHEKPTEKEPVKEETVKDPEDKTKTQKSEKESTKEDTPIKKQVVEVESDLQNRLSQSEVTETKTVEKTTPSLSGVQKAAIAIGSVLGGIIFLAIFFVVLRNMSVILCYDGESKYEKLGRSLIRHKENVHMCILSDMMVENAPSCQYRIILPKWFVQKHKSEDFYICNKNKKAKLRIEESMDFTL